MTTPEYGLLVRDFKAYVLRDATRHEQFDKAIESARLEENGGLQAMNEENIHDLEGYFRYCDDLLKWVPTVESPGDELLQKLLVFYWVFIQSELTIYQTAINPSTIGDDPQWLSYWQVIFAREIGRFLDTKESTGKIKSFYENPLYITEKELWQDEPDGGWASFNQFFAKKWKDIDVARPLADADKGDNVITSAADSTFHGNWPVIDGQVRLNVKGFLWPIKKLVPEDTVGSFTNGSFMHAFLGPTDYHRQHSPVSGTVLDVRIIPDQVYLLVTKKEGPDGKIGLAPDRDLLASTSLTAKRNKRFRGLDAPDEPGYQWCQTRALILIQTEKYGKVAVLPIGMAHVSSVILSVKKGDHVDKGQEISYFQFGGSDIVLVFEKRVKYAVEKGKKCNIRTRIATFE